jgi:L-threonylcarbamoyladenylate synthase
MIHKIIKYSKNSIRLLKQSLEDGNIIAVPTDTVYGLIADAYNEKAVNKIFKTKLRPKKLPLIIFVSSIEEAKKIGHFSKYDELLAKAFWPGDLTLIVKRKSNKIFYGHKSSTTVGIRIPNHKALLNLLIETKKPLASTSANSHKGKAPKNIKELDIISNKEITYTLVSNHKIAGSESTIVSLINDKINILRSGRISISMIEAQIKNLQKR